MIIPSVLAYTLLQNDDGGLIGALFGGFSLICWGAFLVLVIVGLWKVYAKAGQPGWAAIIPIYNIYILTKIIGRPWWWLLLLFIPFVNFIVTIIMAIDLAKSFGKDAAYGILLLWLFSIIGYLILGFGDAEYQGPAAAQKV
jgi:hypothetical protein